MLPDTAAEILRGVALNRPFGGAEYQACIEGIVALRVLTRMREETDAARLNEAVGALEAQFPRTASVEVAHV